VKTPGLAARITKIAWCRLTNPRPTIGGLTGQDERLDMGAMDEPETSACYEFRVRGLLGETLLGAFPGLRARAHGAETVLTGTIPDQAALFGVLCHIEDLGLELLEVRRRRR
jgi:hypothetical protein